MPPGMNPMPTRETLQQMSAMVRAGRAREAVDLGLALLPRHASEVAVHLALVQAWRALGDGEQAQASCRRALAVDARHPGALAELASLSFDAGRLDEAAALLSSLLDVQPGNAHIWFGLGRLRRTLGDARGATEAWSRALKIAPGHAEARLELALLAVDDHPAQALDLIAPLPAQFPRQAERLFVVLQASLRLGDGEGALRAGLALLEAAPHRFLEATAAFAEGAAGQSCLELIDTMAQQRPPHAALAFARGKLLLARARTVEARTAFEHALELQPGLLAAAWGAMQSIPLPAPDAAAEDTLRSDWDRRLGEFEKQLPALLRQPEQIDALLQGPTSFFRHYIEEDPSPAQIRYGRFIAALAEARHGNSGKATTTPTDGRIRVGFASAFLRRHTIWKLFRRFILDLDRSRFAVGVVDLGDLRDAATEELLAAADFRIDSGDGSADGYVAALRSAGLDALLWLDIGMDALTQTLAPLRLAPFQAQFWGHPVTSGFPNIDTFISAELMEPEDGQRFYAGQLQRLPGIGICYDPPDLAPDLDWDLPWRDVPDCVHVVMLQSLPKLTPEHDALLADLADRCPQARFTLVPDPHPGNRERLAQRMRTAFASRGIDFDQRVRLLGGLPEARFLGLLASADLNLDSLRWSGGNTTMEALWFELPTVTLPGRTMRTRHTAAMLRALELDELVADSREDYLEIATRIVDSRAERQRVRAHIAERKHALFSTPAPIRALEALLIEACPPR